MLTPTTNLKIIIFLFPYLIKYVLNPQSAPSEACLGCSKLPAVCKETW